MTDDEATALREYGMAIARAVAENVADPMHEADWGGDEGLAAIVASVEVPGREPEASDDANCREHKLTLEELQARVTAILGPPRPFRPRRRSNQPAEACRADPDGLCRVHQNPHLLPEQPPESAPCNAVIGRDTGAWCEKPRGHDGPHSGVHLGMRHTWPIEIAPESAPTSEARCCYICEVDRDKPSRGCSHPCHPISRADYQRDVAAKSAAADAAGYLRGVCDGLREGEERARRYAHGRMDHTSDAAIIADEIRALIAAAQSKEST